MIILLYLSLSGFLQPEETKIELLDLEGYDEMIKKYEKPVIVNFWAIWCKPCIEEIPDLVELNKNNDRFDLVFVSMDQEKQVNKTTAVLNKRGGYGKHYLLTAKDQKLATIFPKWYGAVPMTLIYKSGKVIASYDRKLTEKDLISINNKF